MRDVVTYKALHLVFTGANCLKTTGKLTEVVAL